ncbi:hypothetical protein GCM10023238_33060 [Streptomyces heliomycini]
MMVAAIEYPARPLRRDPGADHPLLPVPGAEDRQEGLRVYARGARSRGDGAHGADPGALLRPRGGLLRLPGRCRTCCSAARALGLAANITIWHLFLEEEWKAALGIPGDMNTFAAIRWGGRAAGSVR